MSYLGAAHRIWPMSRGSPGFMGVLRHIGVTVLLVVYWLLVSTLFYLIVLPWLWSTILWIIYTSRRRRTISNARAALAGRAGMA